jgi:hypothetical protein
MEHGRASGSLELTRGRGGAVRPRGTDNRRSIRLATTPRASVRQPGLYRVAVSPRGTVPVPTCSHPANQSKFRRDVRCGSLEPFPRSAPERIRTSDLRFRRPTADTPDLALASQTRGTGSPESRQETGDARERERRTARARDVDRGACSLALAGRAGRGRNPAGAHRVSVGSVVVVCCSSAAASSEREARSSFWKTWVRWASTVRRLM